MSSFHATLRSALPSFASPRVAAYRNASLRNAPRLCASHSTVAPRAAAQLIAAPRNTP